MIVLRALRLGHRELFEQYLGYEVLPRCRLCCSHPPNSAKSLSPPAQSFPSFHMVTGQRSRTKVTTACRVVPATTSATTSPTAGV
jgi:hypothetical protein